MSSTTQSAAPGPTIKYWQGFNTDDLEKTNSDGEHDAMRNVQLRIADQYWSTPQVIHFGFFMVSVCSLVLTFLLWEKQFVTAYFILGCGISIIQSLFPHAPKVCDEEKSQMRHGEKCFNYMDCTKLSSQNNLTSDNLQSCSAPVSSTYRGLRMVQFILLVLGAVMIGTGSVEANKDAIHSAVLGFSVLYILTYAF